VKTTFRSWFAAGNKGQYEHAVPTGPLFFS
jgi:hypothetical protein